MFVFLCSFQKHLKWVLDDNSNLIAWFPIQMGSFDKTGKFYLIFLLVKIFLITVIMGGILRFFTVLIE